jgi:hypothetical protein
MGPYYGLYPDPQDVIEAQMDALREGRKPAVLIPPGSFIPKVTDGLKSSFVEEGLLIYRELISLEYAKNGNMGMALGYGIDHKPMSDKVVTARDSKGRIVQEVITDGRSSVMESALQAAGEQGTVTTRHILDALIERLIGLKHDMVRYGLA